MSLLANKRNIVLKKANTFKQSFYRFISSIEGMLTKDIEDNKAIGRYGCETILKQLDGDGQVRILTHCNTGSLATAGYGTALGVIRSLHESKRLGKLCTYIIVK